MCAGRKAGVSKLAVLTSRQHAGSGSVSKTQNETMATNKVQQKQMRARAGSGSGHPKCDAHRANVVLSTDEMPTKSKRSQRISLDNESPLLSPQWYFSDKKTFA